MVAGSQINEARFGVMTEALRLEFPIYHQTTGSK